MIGLSSYLHRVADWLSREAPSGDDVDAAVDIERLARKPPRVRGGEVRAGEAHVHDVDQLANRRALRRFVEQQVEILEPGCGARLQRAGRDCVDANSLSAELV